MDISLFDVAVVVTVAGLVLGRNDIRSASRFVGKAIGKSVGTLQGIRIKFDERSKTETVAALHRNVKDGIRNVSSIGSDIATILSPTVNRAIIEASAGIVSKNTRGLGSSASPNDFRIPASSQVVTPSPSSNNSMISAPPLNMSDYGSSGGGQRDGEEALARLITAGAELDAREGRRFDKDQGLGSDIVLSAINESIMMNVYRRNLDNSSNNSSKGNISNVNSNSNSSNSNSNGKAGT